MDRIFRYRKLGAKRAQVDAPARSRQMIKATPIIARRHRLTARYSKRVVTSLTVAGDQSLPTKKLSGNHVWLTEAAALRL